MWPSAVFVALLCAASQQTSAAVTVPPATTPEPPGAATTSTTHDRERVTTQVGDGQPATRGDFVTSPPSPVTTRVPTLVPISSAAERDDGPQTYQENSQSLADKVVDGLITVCERRLRSVATEAIRELTLQVNSLVSNQRSITRRQDSIEQRLDSLVVQQRGLGQSVDVLQSETRDSIRELSNQHTLSEVLAAELHGNVSGLHRELLTVKSNFDSLASDSYSLDGKVKNISSKQRGISNSLSNLTAQKATNEASLRNITSRQAILKTTVARIQSSVEINAQQISRLVTEQNNVSNQLTVIQSKVQHRPRYLGYDCQSSSQCSQFVPNSKCGADGHCTCAAGFHQSGGSVTRCEQPPLGGSCSSAGQCTTPNAVCTSGVCGCRSGYWNRDNQECRVDARKGETCRYDGDCAAAGGTCINSRCTCSRTVGGYKYRLAEGPSCKEGRVEIRPTGGSWGYVCDDYFDAAAAQVMCRSLGFTGGEPLCCSKYGGADNFHMDDVECTGSESHIRDCPFSGWGRHNCEADEAVSVRCD